jgi:hypothetical protein
MYNRPILWGWPYVFRAGSTAPHYFPRSSVTALLCDVTVTLLILVSTYKTLKHWSLHIGRMRFGLRSALLVVAIWSVTFGVSRFERSAWGSTRVWDAGGPSWRKLCLATSDWCLVQRRPLFDLGYITGPQLMAGIACTVWWTGSGVLYLVSSRRIGKSE